MTAPVTLTGLDAVPLANASERTAPRRLVTVERSLLVGLLDAWQGYLEGETAEAEVAAIIEELGEAIA